MLRGKYVKKSPGTNQSQRSLQMSSSESDGEEQLETLNAFSDIFAISDSYYKKVDSTPKYCPYKSPFRDMTVQLKVVGNHPLWGNYLWNSGVLLANQIEKTLTGDSVLEPFSEKTVLELGAGSALPSLVACLDGAKHVVVTDYPDSELLENIKDNVDKNIPQSERHRITVMVFCKQFCLSFSFSAIYFLHFHFPTHYFVFLIGYLFNAVYTKFLLK